MKIFMIMINVLFLVLFVACGGKKSVTTKTASVGTASVGTTSGGTTSGGTTSGGTTSGGTTSGGTTSGGTASGGTTSGGTTSGGTASGGTTPYGFDIAVSKGDITTMSKLIDQDPNVVNSKIWGYSALGYAIQMDKKVEVVKLLVDKGADIIACSNIQGDSCLHLATQKNTSNHILTLLLEAAKNKGLNNVVNQLNERKETALSNAVAVNNIEGVKLLLKHGAKPDLINEDDNLSIIERSVASILKMDVAVVLLNWVRPTDHNTGLLILLERFPARDITSQALMFNTMEILMESSSDKIPLNKANNNGLTPLLWAKNSQNLNWINLFTKYGAK